MPEMKTATAAYLDHVAFTVRDITPHLTFFRDVLGMTVTKRDGTDEKPSQVWLLGGLQIVEDGGFTGPEGRFAHLGLICADVPAAIKGALAHGGKSLDKGAHWVEMPDGLLLEFLPDTRNAVETVRSLDPRRAR
ncbi:VOC family protein [Ciceribacter sp. RN22]|uniref:VOC family protein n=1 Tax=Ciceribacter sp. RN22 TaxID=2954932 RepID=UPI0020938207|nr:VOC family protein [Ciceribacter sp. RN22]MCO6181078.1 VOC family protein [Ciceribacter sp. RN22]